MTLTPKYTTVEGYEMLRFAQHDNRGVITGHAERSKAESKHLSAPMPNVHWITVVYLVLTLSSSLVPQQKRCTR